MALLNFALSVLMLVIEIIIVSTIFYYVNYQAILIQQVYNQDW